MSSICLILLLILLDEEAEGNLNIEGLRFKQHGVADLHKGNPEGLMVNLQGKPDGIMANIQGILSLAKGNVEEQLASSLKGLLEKTPGVKAEDLLTSIQGLLGKPSGPASAGHTKENVNSKVMHMYKNGQPIIQPRIMRVMVPEGVPEDEEQRMISHVASLNKNMPLGLLRFQTNRNKYTVLNLPPHLRKLFFPFTKR